MNDRGQIGQIITSFPSLIILFLIMLLFIFLSGFMGEDLADTFTSAEVPIIYADTPSQKENIKTNFPEQSSGKRMLINTFLDTIVTPESIEYNVEELIKRTCPFPLKQKGYRLLYERTFSSISLSGKFVIAEAMGSTKIEQIPQGYNIFASNSEKLRGDGVSSEVFLEIFPLNDKTIQRKTICPRLNSHVTIYVLPGDSK